MHGESTGAEKRGADGIKLGPSSGDIKNVRLIVSNLVSTYLLVSQNWADSWNILKGLVQSKRNIYHHWQMITNKQIMSFPTCITIFLLNSITFFFLIFRFSSISCFRKVTCLEEHESELKSFPPLFNKCVRKLQEMLIINPRRVN